MLEKRKFTPLVERNTPPPEPEPWRKEILKMLEQISPDVPLEQLTFQAHKVFAICLENNAPKHHTKAYLEALAMAYIAGNSKLEQLTMPRRDEYRDVLMHYLTEAVLKGFDSAEDKEAHEYQTIRKLDLIR